MKKLTLLLLSQLLLFILCVPCYSDNNIPPGTEEKVKTWMAQDGSGFIENKGQFTDFDGKPVPNVLYKFPANGVDI